MQNDYTPLPSGNPADISELKADLIQNFQGDAANLAGDQQEAAIRAAAILNESKSRTDSLAVLQ